MYQIDFSNIHPWQYTSYDDDISTKRVASTMLYRSLDEQDAQRLGVDRKKVGVLSAVYCAVILKTFKREYASSTPEQIEKLAKRAVWRPNPKGMRGWRNHPDDLKIRSNNRHGSLKNGIAWLEDNLIKILLDYFPGRTAEARQYIRMAGYEDKEINDLVNRTAGRNAKSEFLYRGRSKQPR